MAAYVGGIPVLKCAGFVKTDESTMVGCWISHDALPLFVRGAAGQRPVSDAACAVERDEAKLNLVLS